MWTDWSTTSDAASDIRRALDTPRDTPRRRVDLTGLIQYLKSVHGVEGATREVASMIVTDIGVDYEPINVVWHRMLIDEFDRLNRH